MNRRHFRAGAAWGLVALLAACRPAGQAPATVAAADQERAATEGAVESVPQVVDSQAVAILRRSMDYLNGLQRFSIKTRTLTEDLLQTGHRVDLEFTGSVTVERPNRLRGEKFGEGLRQTIYYDGTNLTLYDHAKQAYASKPAPGTIPEMFEMAYDSLGLSVPTSDLIWPDVFPLMTQGVTFAMVADREIIGGVLCDHLVFSRPGVDFQIWIPVSGPPFPQKYIVTDTGTPALLSIVAWLSDWKVDQRVPASTFTFVPPDGAKAITFLPPATGS